MACSEDESPTMTTDEEMRQEMDEVGEEMVTLPDPTQEGLGTFGCLVDGDVFIEDDDSSNTVYTEVNGDFFFVLTAFNPDGPVRQVKLGSNAAILEEGATYDLGLGASGGYFGEVLFFTNETPVTTAMMGGTMTITKLDQENNIVSGTFSFDVLNPQGDLVEIRQGRFDQLFED